MSSQRKIDSARANGAKSHGPKTEAGRKISSRNAVTHGLYSKGVVIAKESSEQYQEMLDAYIQQFQPNGLVEFDLVEEMVAAKWRQRRLWSIETDLIEDQILIQTEKLDKKYSDYDPHCPLSYAYAALAESGSLPFLTRNESRLERAYSRALKFLLELQRLRKSANENIQKRTESQIRPPKVLPPPPNHHDHPQRETRNEKRSERNGARSEALDVTCRNSIA
jgi:hypothetical protein